MKQLLPVSSPNSPTPIFTTTPLRKNTLQLTFTQHANMVVTCKLCMPCGRFKIFRPACRFEGNNKLT